MVEAVREKLLALRAEIQAMCFYWKETQVHGYCKQANHMDHVCAFCEIVEKLDEVMK